MKISYDKIIAQIFLLFIFIDFFVTGVRHNKINTAMLLTTILFIFIVYEQTGKFIHIPLKLINLILFLTIYFCLSVVFCPYFQFYSIVNFAFLIFLYIAIKNGNKIIYFLSKIDWIYVLMTFLSIVNIIFNYIQKNDLALFNIIGDRNYTGVFIFLLYIYSEKRKYIIGKIVGLVFLMFCTDSRSYFLLFLLFYLVRIFRKPIDKILCKLHMNKFFPFLFVITIVLTVFSYIWVYDISASGYMAHKESLNDTSNRTRFVANVKAVDLLKEGNAIIWGYGDSFKEALGISDYTSGGKFAVYLGMPLVQPHNSVLNPVMKMGVLGAVIYFMLLSDLLNTYFNKENYEYIIPYTINSMLLHSLLETQWLLLWVMIVILPCKNCKDKSLKCEKTKGIIQ